MRQESDIQSEVLREHRKIPGIRLYRNNTGSFFSREVYKIRKRFYNFTKCAAHKVWFKKRFI